MKIPVIILTPLLLFSLLSSASGAEIYKWKDGKGNVFYTDTPPAGVEVEEKRYREDRVERPEVREVKEERHRPRSSAKADKRPYGEIQVIMYVTSWCPYCRKARDLITSTGAHLTEYDIDRDKARGKEMAAKSPGRGVPLIDVEGILIRGYAPEAIREAIERRRSL